MSKLAITANWDKIKTKIKRKYNRLTDEELAFVPGQEEDLVNRIMKSINKDRDYVEFMLSKMQSNMENNRL
ncbi:CsbD family protein [Solitalea canadensis]|uniref:General stress protein CsbD n=1 Tax=Solitalea canadensis (strain ATCC 29591 / DSM 3403 / JCM 21819 / LMG 8368 / NBRC 15130 / NCIMB 12057 / USAM 9D) TaxID=929556 RepID=H8KLP7_SOLCM|nr:hypothetical protein [Solitalea canadensis]AFD09201.1 hypothetical protein Solca_4211 [Solitalea canadensis DSM 3403]